MDERKPAIPSSEFRLRSAHARTAADVDPPPAELAASDAGRGLAQISAEPAENRLPFAVYPFSAHGVDVSARFMAISRKIDQAAGVPPAKLACGPRADSMILVENLNIGSLKLKIRTIKGESRCATNWHRFTAVHGH
jgi:hypothetical protein